MADKDDIVKAVIGAAVALVVAGAGAIAGWCGRGKKEKKNQAKLQEVILLLHGKLRKVEDELADVKNLSKAKIIQLKDERDALLVQISEANDAAA